MIKNCSCSEMFTSFITRKIHNIFFCCTSHGHLTHNSRHCFTNAVQLCVSVLRFSHRRLSGSLRRISKLSSRPHGDEAQALTAGAAKLIGLYGLALTHPLWLPVPCLLPCLRHTREQLLSSDTGKAPLKKPSSEVLP